MGTMRGRRAFITGITGQDGHYLTQLLEARGTEVLGISRRAARVGNATIREVDVTDTNAVRSIISDFAPDECYHLAAYHRSSAVATHLSESQEELEHLRVNLFATHGLIEALAELRPSCKLLLAGSCHMFGAVETEMQSEATPFMPNSPYGITKVAAWQFAKLYRERRGLFCAMAILYNHESPLRGPTFVTARIAEGAARIACDQAGELVLGDLSARVDWGFAGDYAAAMWRMLQHDKPEDFVVASGQLHTVQDFVQLAFDHVGIDWRRHVREQGTMHKPVHSGVYHGDISKIRAKLGWTPSTDLATIAASMVDHHLAKIRTARGTSA
jgi:GDPmannose 4,6-dehydratase